MNRVSPRLASYLSTALLCLLSVVCVQSHAQSQPLDWIVAVVENRVILNSELQYRIEEIRRDLRKQNQPPVPENELRESLLERLIVEHLQLQMGERHGVVISDEQVVEALERIAESRNMSVEEFQDQLQEDGFDIEKYRERLHQELIIEEVQRGIMRSRIQVSAREVEQFLRSNEAQHVTLGQYNMLHIHLPYDPDTGDAKTRARVRECIDILRAAVEKQGPEGVDKLRNHRKCEAQYYDLGWLSFADVPSIFEEILPALQINRLSEAVVAENGSHLAWLLDRRGGSQQIITQHRVAHILVTPSIVRPSQNVQQELVDIRKRVMAGEDFHELALDFSEDPGSKLEGGDLGWVSPGDTDPVFESEMQELPIGSVGQPFETQYGWHLIKVIDKRDYNAAPEMIRRQARSILYRRKYNEELENWLYKIRNEGHVQIRDT